MKGILKLIIICILFSFAVACNMDIEVEYKVITIENMPSFDDIKQSTYAATGTLYSPNSAISWQGEVYPQKDDVGQYYAITNWSYVSNSVYWSYVEYPLSLDHVEGNLVLDDNISVGEYGDYDLYFGASYLSESGWFEVSEYIVSYKNTTQTLDFSGVYNGRQVYVGLFGVHYITGDEIVYEDTQVRGAKLVLTPMAASYLGNTLSKSKANQSSKEIITRNSTGIRFKSEMDPSIRFRTINFEPIDINTSTQSRRNSTVKREE